MLRMAVTFREVKGTIAINVRVGEPFARAADKVAGGFGV